MKGSRSPLYHVPNRNGASVSIREQETENEGEGSDSKQEAKKIEKEASKDINESAEAFIRKFKQQLLIQRLESIENYEQMLARST
ncbi:hypothetical protein NMG60_11002662 [Bertholletia excelsa]